MENKRINVIVAVLTLIVTVFGASMFGLAYFSIDKNEFSSLEFSSATTYNVYAMSGSDIYLHVAGQYMTGEYSDSTKPAFTTNNMTPISLTLETFDSGLSIACTYDLVYETINVFTSSAENVNNEKEYTISGVSNYSDKIEELSLADVEDKLYLAKELKVELSGVNKKKTVEWLFDVNFYNQSFSQLDNMGAKFSGRILLDNLMCKEV